MVTYLLNDGRGIETHTYMTEAAIDTELKTPSGDGEWCVFHSLNPMDQPVVIKIERLRIIGYVNAPFLRKPDVSQARVGGGLIQ